MLPQAREEGLLLVALVARGAPLEEGQHRIDLLGLAAAGPLADDGLGGALELDHALLQAAVRALHHVEPVLASGRPVALYRAAHGSRGYHKD